MSVTLLSDTFTDTNGTLLTAHTMDIGPGWTNVAGTFQIQANQATPNSNASNDAIVTDSGQSDYTLNCLVTTRHGGGWESDTELIVRFADANNYWLVFMTSSGATIQLYEVVAGTFTARVSSSYTSVSGIQQLITVVCQGATINVFVAGTLTLSYSSATSSQTATKVGFRLGTAGTVVTLCTWDNLLVQQLIQFDAASNSGYQSAASSLSWSHNWQGSNRMLSINVSFLSVNDTVTAMTYGGANCTFVGAQTVAGGTGRVEQWRICQNDAGAPAVGSNTISVTLSGSVACAGTAVSRTNVNQTIPTEAWAGNSGINAGSSTNATVAVTPSADHTVVEFALATNANSGISASGTSRNSVSGLLGTAADQDTGQVTPASTQTGTWTGFGPTSVWVCAGYAIRPVGAPAPVTFVYLDLENPRILDKIQVIPR